MYFVKRGYATRLAWFDKTGTVVAPVMRIYAHIGDDPVLSAELTQSTDAPNLYHMTSSITLDVPGQYYAVIEDDSNTIDSQELQCMSDPPVGMYPGVYAPVYVKASELGLDNTDFVKVQIISSSTGLAVTELLDCMFNMNLLSFMQEFALENAGQYAVLWFHDNAPVRCDYLLCIPPANTERCNVLLRSPTLQDTSTDPISYADIVFSREDGTKITQVQTGGDGGAVVYLPVGEVVASFFMDGAVFSKNNVGATVADTKLNNTSNNFKFVTKVFYPQHSEPPYQVPVCTLYAYVSDHTGVPVPFVDILVTPLNRVGTVAAGTWSVGGAKLFKTDQAGYVSFRLKQGIEVDVVIGTTGIRRVITVPSGDEANEPVDLFSLMPAGYDRFSIVKPTIARPERRSF